MDNLKYKCGECNNAYKNKSSLQRHINSCHNNRRYICSSCNKSYVRRSDFIKHTTKYHQPLILKQSEENINLHPTPVCVPNTSRHIEQTTSITNDTTSTRINTSHNIEQTTSVCNGTTDWLSLIKEDLTLSDDEQPTTKVSIATTTDKQVNPDTDSAVNTSPLCLLNMGPYHKELLTTHGLSDEARTYLKINPKPTSQIGCVPLTLHKNGGTQTEDITCRKCTYQEHLILERQAYIIKDAEISTLPEHEEPITSREDRHKMPLPNTSAYKKWKSRLQGETKPKSPKEFPRHKNSPAFTKAEIKVTSKPQQNLNPHLKKPSALTIDNTAYEAICSRVPTRPTLVTSPRKIILPPPPPNGAWSYRTTKF